MPLRGGNFLEIHTHIFDIVSNFLKSFITVWCNIVSKVKMNNEVVELLTNRKVLYLMVILNANFIVQFFQLTGKFYFELEIFFKLNLLFCRFTSIADW